jgi:hypothetical protein
MVEGFSQREKGATRYKRSRRQQLDHDRRARREGVEGADHPGADQAEFFGVDTESDWEAGSPLVHRGEWQGKPYEDRGKILKIDPPRLLVHTHWSDLSGLPDRPENYQEVIWVLKELGAMTKLTVTERNLPSEEAKAVSENVWKTALTSLKGVLED